MNKSQKNREPEVAASTASPLRPTSGSRRRRWLRRLVSLTLGLIVGLTFAEVALRITGIVESVGPSFTTYDAQLGKRLKRNFTGWYYAPEFSMRYSTNSLGFRGPEPDGDDKGGIVFLGDSFTFGFGVSDGEEYPALVSRMLEERLEGGAIPVVNMGMCDNGNGQWIKLLRDQVAQFEPRLVVLQFCGFNDFVNNARERLFRLDEDGRLHELPIPDKSWMRRIQPAIESLPWISYSHVFCLVKKTIIVGSLRRDMTRKIVNEPVLSSELTRSEKLTYALVRRSIEMCKSQGWPVVLLVVLEDDRILQNLESITRDLSVDMVRVPLKQDRPELYFQVDGHWNREGHEYIGRLMTEKIAELPQFQEF